MGGTPMGLSLSSLGMSPSGFTPGMGGLPIAGFTPGSSTGGGSTAAAMMMPSMSDLGLSSSSSSKRGGAGGGDHERRRKMKVVLRKIGGRSGGVCEEGICRVSRRVGLANDVDAEGEEARREREGERAISIAGRDVLIDVDMKGNRARGVVVAGMGGVGQEEMEKAGKVLEGLLIDGGEGDLEAFGRELGRIASLDRVGERGVSAFEAVSGVGKSLKRLHERECEGEDDERRVLRKRSGRPWMHSRGRIGLGVDYWTTAPSKDDNAMDLDHQQRPEDAKEDPADFLTLHITAETCPAGMYPPVRISSNWLPEDLPSFNNNKADSSNEPQDADFQIPWQDPPPTYTTPPEDEQTSANETQQQQNSKLPDIRFLAKLEPPLVLPLQTASQILAEMGGEGVQGMFREWHLLLADEAGITSGGEGAAAQVLGGCAIVAGKEGQDVKHAYKLDFTKPEWGYRLSEVPFAHPRQVVGILPVLRQWGVFGGMVRSLLARNDVDVKVEGRNAQKEVKQDDLLSSLLTPPSSQPEEHERAEEKIGGGEGGVVRICVEVSTSPEPTLSISLPLSDERQTGGGAGKMGRVVLSVGRNADVRCSLVEGFGDDDEAGDGVKGVRERMARALEVCDGDLGVWGERDMPLSISQSLEYRPRLAR